MQIAKRVGEAQWWSVVLRRRSRAAWYLRGARRVGSWPAVIGSPFINATDLEIGDQFRLWSSYLKTNIGGPGPIRIGSGVFINGGVVLYATVGITIGDDVALANEVYVTDTNSHGIEGKDVFEAPVSIGSGTWVGARSMILPGVSIGSRVLVAAGSVVTKDVPDDVLVAGNPARVVRALTYPPGCLRAWHDFSCRCPAVLAAGGGAEPSVACPAAS